MAKSRRGPSSARATGLARAFDAARFGSLRTLDLHQWQPTAQQAADRVDTWVQERQLQGETEVLVITGRGAHSADGLSPVREAVLTRLGRLRRAGVIREMHEHSAGSFVATLAHISQRFDAPARRRDPAPAPPVLPAVLAALEPETLQPLRALAEANLYRLGLREPTPGQVDLEMRAQFARLTPGLPEAPWREPMLREAIARALDEVQSG